MKAGAPSADEVSRVVEDHTGKAQHKGYNISLCKVDVQEGST